MRVSALYRDPYPTPWATGAHLPTHLWPAAITPLARACYDFFVAVTATFRMLYVFVVIEHGTRRLAHINVTVNPTADWTLQQLRAVVGEEGAHQYLIHDRDKIFAKGADESIRALGLKVPRSPVASPKANSICERVIAR